jgi:hypothetical protein
MDGRQFVDWLKIVVGNKAVSEELSVLQSAPGMRPHELLERSNGYIFLLESQEEILFSIIMASLMGRFSVFFACRK